LHGFVDDQEVCRCAGKYVYSKRILGLEFVGNFVWHYWESAFEQATKLGLAVIISFWKIDFLVVFIFSFPKNIISVFAL
jgi:hypothetical protein